MTSFPLDELLPQAVLALRESLPLKPRAVNLDGRFVLLRPLDLHRDLHALHIASNGDAIALGDRHVGAYDADALIGAISSTVRSIPQRPLVDFSATL